MSVLDLKKRGKNIHGWCQVWLQRVSGPLWGGKKTETKCRLRLRTKWSPFPINAGLSELRPQRHAGLLVGRTCSVKVRLASSSGGRSMWRHQLKQQRRNPKQVSHLLTGLVVIWGLVSPTSCRNVGSAGGNVGSVAERNCSTHQTVSHFSFSLYFLAWMKSVHESCACILRVCKGQVIEWVMMLRPLVVMLGDCV